MALRRTLIGCKVLSLGGVSNPSMPLNRLRVVGVSSLQPFCSERTLCS
jgi:hypothetical protein